MPKKRSTQKTGESKRAEREKLMETDTYRQGDTPTQPEPKISNRRGRPAPCRIAATQPPLLRVGAHCGVFCLFVVVFHRAQAGCAMLRLLVRGCALPVGYLARRSDGALEPLSWAQFG